MIKNLLFSGLLLCLLCAAAVSQSIELRSPDRKLVVNVRAENGVKFSVLRDGTPIISDSLIDLGIEGRPNRIQLRVVGSRSENSFVEPVVWEKRARIEDRYNETTIAVDGSSSLIFRAYNNGIAYRWATNIDGQIVVKDETLNIKFAEKASTVFYPEEKSFYSHNERLYKKYSVTDLTQDKLASLPLLVRHPNGTVVLFAEADLYDYAGLWVRGNDGEGLKAVFPPYPKVEKRLSDRDLKPEETEDFIARTNGRRNFPWRVFAIEADEKDLLSNQLVYLVSESTAADFSWVRPGKIAWDWWNANNAYGVDFKSGVNTATYKHFIDFAAKYKLEYVIFDEGWSKPEDLFAINPDMDMEELTRYAKSKGVGIIVWCLWTALDEKMDAAFAQFKKWDIKGVKVDFMQRDDQKAVNFYEKSAKKAAENRMLINFHGSYKPTGFIRKYPNALTREGVYGGEQSKWDDTKAIAPPHNVTLPFTRMAVGGGMDYTPGAMNSEQLAGWKPSFNRPSSLGTRVHQMAMYVIYESGLQMLSDNPANYYKEPESTAFISKVPVVWRQTIPLYGKVGEYVALARQAKNGDWFIGAMNDWNERELEIDLSFLDGNYTAEIFADGVNANRVAIDYKRSVANFKKGDKLKISLAKGGGWAAHLRPATRRK